MNELDRAQEIAEKLTDAGINKAQNAVANMPKGVEGECTYCEEFSPRLVGSPLACARCRDKYKLG